MPEAEFFQRLGLFVIPEFLDADACAALRRTVCSSTQSRTQVLADGRSLALKESVRRVERADVPSADTAALAARLAELKPRLEEHFGLTLDGVQWPDFLIYRTGAFFRPHRDRSAAPEAPSFSRERRVSVVLFLNGTGEEDGAFEGGALTFYGLCEDPRACGLGLPLRARERLLLAFPADTVHQVTPVTRGVRYSVVTWFFASEPIPDESTRTVHDSDPYPCGAGLGSLPAGSR